VGRTGECCSQWGFCGKKPYHCVTRLGCQSDCNDDLDSKLESGTSDAPPVPVVPKADANAAASKIIIKQISPAVPLCKDCNKHHDPVLHSLSQSIKHDLSMSHSLAPMGSSQLFAPASLHSSSGISSLGLTSLGLSSSSSSAEPEGSGALTPQSYAKEVANIKGTVEAAAAQAAQILAQAQARAAGIQGGSQVASLHNTVYTIPASEESSQLSS